MLMLKNKSVGISHVPASDEVTLRSESAYFRLNDFWKIGMSVGLGADEPWNLSVFNVIRLAKKIQINDGNSFPASLYFYLYTLGGANALGLGEICGNFKKNKKEDFVVLDIDKLVKWKGMKILDDKEKLLEALSEVGDESIIKAVYINGKKVFEFYEEVSDTTQSISREFLKLLQTFQDSMLYEFGKLKKNFRENQIRPFIENFLNRIFTTQPEALHLSTIVGIFHNIS